MATLVNEEKQSGTYEVEFDGTGLPSGTYFYKLKAGNFETAKKMVLIK
ncbi:MAG: T9SS type A sorting domain-containing protein [Ignavibacteriaceae bacterium]|nr:T9SS type A sorting domain-containing protein [Ignavibacteriaceae bacterium]